MMSRRNSKKLIADIANVGDETQHKWQIYVANAGDHVFTVMRAHDNPDLVVKVELVWDDRICESLVRGSQQIIAAIEFRGDSSVSASVGCGPESKEQYSIRVIEIDQDTWRPPNGICDETPNDMSFRDIIQHAKHAGEEFKIYVQSEWTCVEYLKMFLQRVAPQLVPLVPHFKDIEAQHARQTAHQLQATLSERNARIVQQQTTIVQQQTTISQQHTTIAQKDETLDIAIITAVTVVLLVVVGSVVVVNSVLKRDERTKD